jgi:RhoGAP domain
MKHRVTLFVDSKSAVQLMKTADIASVTALLKLYFRSLPEPLFTYNFYQEFVNAMSEYNMDLMQHNDGTAYTVQLYK